ncbi:FHA domain-containing protein [Nocardia sp. NPDC051750]|uniref:FHA domain-containing protein n=1 Tax=Nocardia sp. NPDC051750 TaxID=3364325 RepID=UPI0037937F94
MEIDGFVPQILPSSMRSLASGVPPAPPGTIFALGSERGYAFPPGRYTVRFGRSRDNVHVPVGVNDSRISRKHGVLECDGNQWSVRNDSQLPIQLPGERLLLTGQEAVVEPGYTPMFIGARKHQRHLLEIHVVTARTCDPGDQQHSQTKPPDVYPLSFNEQLVLTALAQRYLRQERYPQPLSWNQVADDLNRSPDERLWTPKTVSHIVATVRERLSTGPDPITGIRIEDGIGEPVGNTLNHNLIQALLRSSTLVPANLRMLGNTIDDDQDQVW